MKTARELVHQVPALAGGCDNPNYIGRDHSIVCDALTELIENRDAQRVTDGDCDIGSLLGVLVARLIQREGMTKARETVIGVLDDVRVKLGTPQ